MCLSYVLYGAGVRVFICTAQMKHVSNKCQKHIMFVDFSNHARAQVPFFTPKVTNLKLTRLARFASGNGIFDAARNLENSRTGARMM